MRVPAAQGPADPAPLAAAGRVAGRLPGDHRGADRPGAVAAARTSRGSRSSTSCPPGSELLGRRQDASTPTSTPTSCSSRSTRSRHDARGGRREGRARRGPRRAHRARRTSSKAPDDDQPAARPRRRWRSSTTATTRSGSSRGVDDQGARWPTPTRRSRDKLTQLAARLPAHPAQGRRVLAAGPEVRRPRARALQGVGRLGADAHAARAAGPRGARSRSSTSRSSRSRTSASPTRCWRRRPAAGGQAHGDRRAPHAAGRLRGGGRGDRLAHVRLRPAGAGHARAGARGARVRAARARARLAHGRCWGRRSLLAARALGGDARHDRGVVAVRAARLGASPSGCRAGGGALAFGALGVAIGALAREVRAASLLAFLLALPIAFLALVPAGAVASGLYDVIRVVSALFPFRAALEAVDAALNDARRPGGALAHLAALAVGWAVARARSALQRFALRSPCYVRAPCSATSPRASASTPAHGDPPAGRRRRDRVRRCGRRQPRAHRAVGADPRRGALHRAGQRRDAAPRRRGLGARDRLRVRGPGPQRRRPRSSAASRWGTSCAAPWRNATLGYWVGADAGGRGPRDDARRG